MKLKMRSNMIYVQIAILLVIPRMDNVDKIFDWINWAL